MATLFQVLTPEEAWAVIAGQMAEYQPEGERVSIELALGRVLAEAVIAREDLPAFDRATMDGLAVCAGDTFGAGEGLPALLTVAGEVAMGETAGKRIRPGEGMWIATGGLLPAGADAVVMVEYTEVVDASTVAVVRPVAPGENIVRQGDDIKQGEILLPAGVTLKSQDIGALAGLGVTCVTVSRRPRVAVISTGDELVPLTVTPQNGQIRDINSYSLAAAVEQAGGEAIRAGIVRDDYDLLLAAVRSLLATVDLVVISGGSSVGTRDMTAAVIDALGAPGVLVHGVAVRPGKPTLFGCVDGRPVFGLPGHPVSALTVFDLLVRPVIRRMLGERGSKPRGQVLARLGRNLASAPGREDFYRVRLVEKNGSYWAHPILGKSGLITTMVRADGMIRIPLDQDGLQAGEWVQVTLF